MSDQNQEPASPQRMDVGGDYEEVVKERDNFEQMVETATNRSAKLSNENAALLKRVAELETANTEQRLDGLALGKSVNPQELSFEQKSKIYVRQPAFDSSKSKMGATAWLTGEYSWCDDMGLPESSVVHIVLTNLHPNDRKQIADQLQQADLNVEGRDVAPADFRQLFLAQYGELDPDTSAFNKFLDLRQNNKSISQYCKEYAQSLAQLSSEVGMNDWLRVHFFLRHMNKEFKQKLAVNPATMRVWKEFKEVLQAARSLGSVIPHDDKDKPSSQSQSGQKRPRDGPSSGGQGPVNKKGATHSQTPTRSEPEMRYLKAHKLCFHCMAKDKHLSSRCDQKRKGVVAKPMPADFKLENWQADGQSSKE